MAASSQDPNKRPDPDALLTLAEKDRRGKLTVFLGAAPGVGKTYAMLSRARRLQDDGVDIVVGLVETHGRSETADLLQGLKILPRRSIEYRGRILQEFDLDAALARKPRILIVDELAHTNPEGSLHPKRYQDIEELIEAGIDVWTALNIQHLESLSDLVTQITGVTIRERVPDTVLSKADEVLLVDLPPAELVERLREGKVYLAESASRAIERFFRIGNLTALRELALRRTADRVDDQMIDYLRQNAIEGPWATGERLIVCIGTDPLSEKVVRTASRLASGLNASWIVAHVERADREVDDSEALQRLERTFQLAEQLGADLRRLTGNDFAEEILKLVRREHATQIVIGTARKPRWRILPRLSLPEALARHSPGIALHLVPPDDDESNVRFLRKPLKLTNVPRSLLVATAAVVVATAIGVVIDSFVHLPNLSIIFLLAVLSAATYAGLLAALVAAGLSTLAYNFFFIVPRYTFTVAEPYEVFALFAYLGAAVLAGSLAARIREQGEAARVRATAMQALYDFSRKLSGTVKYDDVLWAAVTQLQASVKGNAILLLPEEADLKTMAAWPPDTEPGVSDMTAARWAYEKREPAGKGTGTLPNSRFHFRPLITPHGAAGVCGIEQGDTPPDIVAERMLTAILDQTAIAIDRARLSRTSIEQATRLEGERYRDALLSSISHDLRTPLATITGAVSSLRELGAKMRPESRDDLLQSIEQESERLSRFVANLLDMSRIEAGMLKLKREWVDVADVVRASTDRARKYFPGHTIETGIAPDLPLIEADSVLLGQVLFNLLDNAVKYGGPDPINVYARRDGDNVLISVTDLGKGIPTEDLERVFDKFFRRGKADGRSPGTGLGLSIARGFVEAMGGKIRAESPAVKKKGTRIVMKFPVTDAPACETIE
ncbi:sensor histidine kinase KdpD [Rhizobium sp.]|jgi:two-component system, OmpR family, sensor histidine kinase KdpD|uniref:sensor histidine kinase KdpD n=1 Tax=Rhizobium sp. TaxID=391 RepID=UPI000E84C7FE|nr:sensor histidine kinase KdpD [Rhizobium sp.]